MPRLATALLFFSGFAALCYEVLWSRQFGKILGSTATANSAVFSAFLSSMALGAFWWSRYRPKFNNRKLYGILECAAGICSGIVTISLLHMETFWAGLIPQSGWFLMVLSKQFLLAFLLLGVPGFLLGGTLPVLLDAIRVGDKSSLPWFYGVNTLGAAGGALASGGLLIWHLGIQGTLAVAVVLNLGVGMAAFFFLHDVEQQEPLPTTRPLWTKRELMIAFWSGFLILGFEVVWARLARFLLGERTIAVAVLLALYLSALGLAGLLAPWIARKQNQAIAKVCSGAAFLQLGGLYLAIQKVPIQEPSFSGRFTNLALALFVPVLVSGLVFPILLYQVRGQSKQPGRVLGMLYLVNTTGAVFGAIFVTYAITRWRGTVGAGLFLVVLFCLLGLIAGKKPPAHCWVSLIMVLGLGVLILPPQLSFHTVNENVVAYEEDEYGVHQVLSEGPTFTLRSNKLNLIAPLGKAATDEAQQMAAHLSTLLADQATSVLNIGTGYGITAGTFTLYPEIESIESVELLPFVARNQELFADYNFRYYQDPRVKIVIGDGRHRLLSGETKYDIISVNVLDPYLPGSSSLYTVDFWKQARSRLKPGGVYTQLIWGEHAHLLAKGLETIFPRVYYFPAYQGPCYNIVALNEPGESSPLFHLERLNPKTKLAISRFTNAPADEYLKAAKARANSSARTVKQRIEQLQETPLHTEDFPHLEYTWSLITQSPLDSPLVK